MIRLTVTDRMAIVSLLIVPLVSAQVVSSSTRNAATQQPSGTIRGTVCRQDGSPYPGARVTYRNVQRYTAVNNGRWIPSEPLISSGVLTDSLGAFELRALPDGEYWICVFGNQRRDLSPCDWANGPLVVRVSQGIAIDHVSLTVDQGRIVSFTVRDPRNHIQDPPNQPFPLSVGNLQIGVIAGGRFEPARLAARTGDVRTYEVAIPKDIDASLFVSTPLILREAGGGKIVRGTPSLPISASQGNDQTLEIAVE